MDTVYRILGLIIGGGVFYFFRLAVFPAISNIPPKAKWICDPTISFAKTLFLPRLCVNRGLLLYIVMRMEIVSIGCKQNSIQEPSLTIGENSGSRHLFIRACLQDRFFGDFQNLSILCFFDLVNHCYRCFSLEPCNCQTSVRSKQWSGTPKPSRWYGGRK